MGRPRKRGVPSFGGLEGDDCCPRKSRFRVLPIPYERTTTYGRGAREGPAAILAASAQVELWDNELERDTSRQGIHTLPAPPVRLSPKGFVSSLARHVEALVEPDRPILALGGEHTVTVGLVAGHRAHYPKLGVLQIDAHADLRETYEGSPFNHACVARRLLDHHPLVQVGIRSFCEEEHHRMRGPGVRTFLAHRVRDYRALGRRLPSLLPPDVYITVDVDGLDPSVIPGTGTPEPGGLSWSDILDVLRPVFLRRRVVGMDIVEVAPLARERVSEFAAAKLAYRMLGYWSVGMERRKCGR